MKLVFTILQLLFNHVSTMDIHTIFEEVQNNHYFRQIGKIIGASSFAHMAIEIDPIKLKNEVDAACRCAYVVPNMWGKLYHTNGKWKKRSKKVKEERIIMYDTARNICQDLQKVVNEIIYAFSPIQGHDHKIIDVLRPGNHTRSDPVLSTRQKRVIVTGTVFAITGLASLFTGWMIRKLWDGGDNDEIIERMDTDDLRIRDSASKLEVLSKTVLDIIENMEEEKEKNVFDFTAMTCTHEII